MNGIVEPVSSEDVSTELFLDRTSRFAQFQKDLLAGGFGPSINRNHIGEVLIMTRSVVYLLSQPVSVPPTANGVFHADKRTIVLSSNPRQKCHDLILGSQGKKSGSKSVIVLPSPRGANPIHVSQIRGLQDDESLNRASALVISLRYDQLTENQVAAEHRGILKNYGLLR